MLHCTDKHMNIFQRIRALNGTYRSIFIFFVFFQSRPKKVGFKKSEHESKKLKLHLVYLTSDLRIPRVSSTAISAVDNLPTGEL